MNITTVAAYGGLFLGVVNLCILLYKEFFKKGILEIMDEEFFIKAPDRYPIEYVIQINLRFHAKFDPVQIRRVYLVNERKFTNHRHENLSEIELHKAIPFKSIDVIKVGFNEYPAARERVYRNISEELVDMRVEKGSIKSLTFSEILGGVRESDGWELLPTDDWYLKILFDKKELCVRIEPRFIS